MWSVDFVSSVYKKNVWDISGFIHSGKGLDRGIQSIQDNFNVENWNITEDIENLNIAFRVNVKLKNMDKNHYNDLREIVTLDFVD